MERCDQALACQRAAAGRRHQHHYHNGRARRAYAFCWNIGLWSTIRWARLMLHVEWTFVCLELRRNFNKDIWGCFSGPDLDEEFIQKQPGCHHWIHQISNSWRSCFKMAGTYLPATPACTKQHLKLVNVPRAKANSFSQVKWKWWQGDTNTLQTSIIFFFGHC